MPWRVIPALILIWTLRDQSKRPNDASAALPCAPHASAQVPDRQAQSRRARVALCSKVSEPMHVEASSPTCWSTNRGSRSSSASRLPSARASSSAWTMPTTCRAQAGASAPARTSILPRARVACALRRGSRWAGRSSCEGDRGFPLRSGIHAYHAGPSPSDRPRKRRAGSRIPPFWGRIRDPAQGRRHRLPPVHRRGRGPHFRGRSWAPGQIQPGSYFFMDGNYGAQRWAPPMPRFEHPCSCCRVS